MADDLHKTAIRKLFTVFPVTGNDGREAMRMYFELLREFNGEVLSRCVDWYCTGRIQSHDGKYRPTAPEIAKEIRTNWIVDDASLRRFAEIWNTPGNWIEDSATKRLPAWKRIGFAFTELERSEGQ